MILVTGVAGFIGFHVARRLLDHNAKVVGIDNLNDYYAVSLKEARLARLQTDNFRFIRLDIADRKALLDLFAEIRPTYVIHLAAQAGVRYSIQNPEPYIASNLVGFANILEGCRNNPVKHLVYASSSSVYGGNTDLPFSTGQRVDSPLSLYAATKKANELMAHAYNHLYKFPATGLRFFTVYGPWGRPDMALFTFARAILAGKPVDVYDHGRMQRDFTYIDDIVDGVLNTTVRPPEKHAVYNLGNHRPVAVTHVLDLLENSLGKKAERHLLPIQPGDVPATFADITDATRVLDFYPRVPVEEGIPRFVQWYLSYYGG